MTAAFAQREAGDTEQEGYIDRRSEEVRTKKKVLIMFIRVEHATQLVKLHALVCKRWYDIKYRRL